MPEFNDIYSPITREELQQIPEAMKAEPRWICWGSEKMPASVVRANNGRHFGSNVTGQKNCGTFTDAKAYGGNPASEKLFGKYNRKQDETIQREQEHTQMKTDMNEKRPSRQPWKPRSASRWKQRQTNDGGGNG